MLYKIITETHFNFQEQQGHRCLMVLISINLKWTRSVISSFTAMQDQAILNLLSADSASQKKL